MKVAIIAGTRPEVVKLAPVRAAINKSIGMRPHWIATGQHGALAEQAMDVFKITPDVQLELDWNGTALTSLSSALIRDLGEHFCANRPDFVLVQGDTASAFCGATAAFLQGIPVGHVEAGLRSGDLKQPFPEEGFRRLVAPIADLHFAPTRSAARHLAREGITNEKVRVTGNTVIDAVKMVGAMNVQPEALDRVGADQRLVLVTLHRRENWDDGVEGVCAAIKTMRDEYPDLHFVLPIHLNPRVRGPIEKLLGQQERIELIEPLAYPAFVAVMKRAHLILSDSGGIQEEAPSFGVPVLVLREKTEREEAIKAGVAKLVGTRKDHILNAARQLLNNPRAYGRMARSTNPFGDGRAALRIADAVARFVGASRIPKAKSAPKGHVPGLPAAPVETRSSVAEPRRVVPVRA
jgi:UDP-N-acetylglucosamine 2-epimerase (non-hydrolysing)